MTEDMFTQKGWICPKCGRVLSPNTLYCLWCCNTETITTSSTNDPWVRTWDTTPIKTADTPLTERSE